MDDGYPNDVQGNTLVNVVPARINGVGYNNRFSMILRMYSNDFINCKHNFNDGFIVSMKENCKYQII